VLVLGLGMAISVAPLSTTVMNAVDPAHAGLASGINNAVSRTSGLVALAVFGVFVVLAFDSRLEQRIDALQLPAQVQSAVVEQRGKLAAVEIPGGLDAATTGAIRAAIDSSFVSGFRVAMVAAAGLALGASGCAALTMKRDQSRL